MKAHKESRDGRRKGAGLREANTKVQRKSNLGMYIESQGSQKVPEQRRNKWNMAECDGIAKKYI